MTYHGLLQGRGPLAYSVPLILHRVLLHPCLETLPESAEPALVPLVLVHSAVAREPAAVGVLLADAPSEEPLASVTGGGAIVLTSGSVPTYCTILRENTGSLYRRR